MGHLGCVIHCQSWNAFSQVFKSRYPLHLCNSVITFIFNSTLYWWESDLYPLSVNSEVISLCLFLSQNSIVAKEEYMAPLFDMFSKSVHNDVRLVRVTSKLIFIYVISHHELSCCPGPPKKKFDFEETVQNICKVFWTFWKIRLLFYKYTKICIFNHNIPTDQCKKWISPSLGRWKYSRVALSDRYFLLLNSFHFQVGLDCNLTQSMESLHIVLQLIIPSLWINIKIISIKFCESGKESSSWN